MAPCHFGERWAVWILTEVISNEVIDGYPLSPFDSAKLEIFE